MPDTLPDPPLGPVVADWTPRPLPPRTPLDGRWCRLEPLDPDRHAADLWAAAATDPAGRTWTYLGYGPFADAGAHRAFLEQMAAGTDPQVFAVIEATSGRALGVLSFLRMDPANGVVEIGHVWFPPPLARTTAATEAVILLLRRAFDGLGYRRVEWKCNDLNAASRRAAERLGFSYEGTFRQAGIVKGRNRDTAWYAMIDGDWPAVRAAAEAWLAPANFDAEGRQKTPLRVR